MKIPGWAWAVLGLGLGCAGRHVSVSAVSIGKAGWAAGALLLFGGFMVLVVAALRAAPAASAPPVLQRVSLEVPSTVKLGGDVAVQVRLFLPAKLPLNIHRQRLRFVIEERWDYGGEDPDPTAIVHEEVLPLSISPDTVGPWELSWTPRVPLNAPMTFAGRFFRIHAWVELTVPYGMFSSLSAKRPVVILPELAS